MWIWTSAALGEPAGWKALLYSHTMPEGLPEAGGSCRVADGSDSDRQFSVAGLLLPGDWKLAGRLLWPLATCTQSQDQRTASQAEGTAWL